MKKFKVTVNGKTYEVEVEETGTGSSPAAAKKPSVTRSAAPATPPPAPVAVPAPAPAAAGPAPGIDGGTVLKAPMPGTILAVKVKEGDRITRGQLLLILEAMKMENEIMSVADGQILSVHVEKGAAVSADDPLITLRFDS